MHLNGLETTSLSNSHWVNLWQVLWLTTSLVFLFQELIFVDLSEILIQSFALDGMLWELSTHFLEIIMMFMPQARSHMHSLDKFTKERRHILTSWEKLWEPSTIWANITNPSFLFFMRKVVLSISLFSLNSQMIQDLTTINILMSCWELVLSLQFKQMPLDRIKLNSTSRQELGVMYSTHKTAALNHQLDN